MSSSPDSFQNSFDSHEPRPELESPFLNEEYLTEEARTAQTWRIPVPGFQLESPFLQAFEVGWGAIGEAEFEDYDEFLNELEEEEFDELEEDFDNEEQLFEFYAAVPTRDYSLQEIADGTLGNAPNDIRSEILNSGNQDTNALTYKVFWQRHPALNGMMLDRKDPRQKKLREEWSRILNRQIKPLIWLRGIVELLDKYRGDIPRDFLLGWMAVESDGKVTTKTKRPEHGYFQIDWKAGEAQKQLKLSEKNFLRLSSDREYSIQMGVKLAQIYRRYLLDRYNLTDGTELLWHLTKARHGASGTLKFAMDKLVREGKDITWSAVSGNMSATDLGRKVINNVNKVFRYAALLKPIADLVPSPPVTTPEVSAPPFEGEWGAISEPEVEESDEFLDELKEEKFEEEELVFETKEEEPASVETLKQEIVRLAQEQLKRWKSGVLREVDVDGLNILKEYYRNCGVKIFKKDKLGDRKWHCKNPWSAVFVSWIMKQAGAGNKFRYSRSHQWYIIEAKKNHDKKDKDKPFWAFSVTEIAPEVGDLVCRDRPCGECDDCSGATFENIDKPKGKPTDRCIHCDIVTEKRSSSNEIVVIGGNLGDSVREQVVKIDTDGKVIPDQGECKFFAVITLRDRTVGSSPVSKELQEEQPKLESWHDFFDESDDEANTELEEWESEGQLYDQDDDLDLEHIGILEFQVPAKPTSPTLGFEFDLNFGFEEEVVKAKRLLPPTGFNWPSEGLKVTDHEWKDLGGQLKDGFVVTMDAVRMEISTAPFHIDNDTEFNTIETNVMKFGQELISASKSRDRHLIVPGFSGHPTTFEHPRTVVNKPDVKAFGDQDKASYQLATVPLVIHRVSGAYPTKTELWASPQATLTLPLSEFGKLVWEIHKTMGGASGEAFTGPRTARLGLRDDLAWLALNRAMADRKKKLGTVLSDGSKVTDADFTRTITSLVTILIMYMLTSIKRDSRDEKVEAFAKGSLPLNVKTPLWQIHKFALTAREKFILHELYTDSGKRKNLFVLASGRTGGDGATKLFPNYTHVVDIERFLDSSPTWYTLIDVLVKEEKVIVTKDNLVPKKKHQKGDEILIAPLSSKIDFDKTKPRIAVEMRRIGFAPVNFNKWLRLMNRIRELAKKVNP